MTEITLKRLLYETVRIVICKYMYSFSIHVCVGFTDAMVVPSMDFIEDGEYWPYNVNCSGTEALLSDCSTMCIPIAVKCQLPGMYVIAMMQTSWELVHL